MIYLRPLLKPKIQIISKIQFFLGFDPAAPMWSTNGLRITSTDAEYVEIIHTDAGGLGILYPAGHNDFYPPLPPDDPEEPEGVAKFLSSFVERAFAYI